MALLVAFAAPASAAVLSNRTGVLHGTVTHGPACSPAQPPCGEPVPGVKIVFLRHGQPVAQTTTTNVGTYRIRLHAGSYGVRLPGQNQWKPTQVRVLRGTTTRVNITIDSLTG